METGECSNSKGQGCVTVTQSKNLSSIISRIYELQLITELEKQTIVKKTTPAEIKEELFDLLSRKESKVASKILKIVRIFRSAEEALHGGNGDNQALGNEIKNPMKIDIIIKEVFGFLNLDNIKNCRLVCKKWDNVAQPFVRKRSKIVFLRTSQNNRKNTSPVGFNETFRICGTAVPFTSFSFSSWDSEDGWTVSEITNFFEQHGRNVKELEFHNLVLITDLNDRSRIDDYDISLWISGLPIRKLVIDCFESYLHTNLMVPLSQLQHVKILRLKNCNVDTELGNRISLLELELEHVMFYCDDRELDPCALNDYVDFKDTNSVLIHCSAEESVVILDLKDFTNVNEFNLKECTIVNWGISRCSVNKMKLVDIPLSERTGMKIKELRFKNSSIDLVALPVQIEKLKCSNNTEITCSQPINLPKLEFLYLKKTKNLLVLTHFLNCEGLVDIHIRNSFRETSTLNLDWLPANINRLKLEGDIDIENGPLQLDTLVLEKSSFLNAASIILSKIRPQVLVMNWNPGYEVNDAAALFRHQFKDVGKFYVGPFHWKKNSFSKGLLAMYVDREANYYLFQDQLGKAIDISEFNSRNFNI